MAAVALALAAAPAWADSFPVTVAIELDAPFAPGDFAWDDSDAPAGGALRIVADLDREELHVYRGGVEIGRSSITYGGEGKPTPTGEFTILQKDADHVSSTYAGAPMPWMLRLTWQGVAIHGAEIDPEWGTHGCIGVPDEFARLLYRTARLGDRVLVTRGWRRDVYG